MNKKIKYIVIILIFLFTIVIALNLKYKEERIYYKDYIINLKNEYDNNFAEAIIVVEDRLKNEDLNNYEKSLNLLALETYLFFEGNYKKVKEYFPYIEKDLINNNLYEELVYLYSMMTNIAKSESEYEQAYLYIRIRNTY